MVSAACLFRPVPLCETREALDLCQIWRSSSYEDSDWEAGCVEAALDVRIMAEREGFVTVFKSQVTGPLGNRILVEICQLCCTVRFSET